jgi:hypothetical protein
LTGQWVYDTATNGIANLPESVVGLCFTRRRWAPAVKSLRFDRSRHRRHTAAVDQGCGDATAASRLRLAEDSGVPSRRPSVLQAIAPEIAPTEFRILPSGGANERNTVGLSILGLARGTYLASAAPASSGSGATRSRFPLVRRTKSSPARQWMSCSLSVRISLLRLPVVASRSSSARSRTPQGLSRQ